MDFDSNEYVTPEEAARRYPQGAAGVGCRYCGRILIVNIGTIPYCDSHCN
ncbi:MAG TPA: hypothetical protein VHX17_02640 [Candidatus Cybelea sp.]|jgi:hypothetical protein|nr:hypothetical protein [Candidatus Cybelea sp.]